MAISKLVIATDSKDGLIERKYIGSTDKSKLNFYFGGSSYFLCFRKNDNTYYIPLRTSGTNKLRIKIGEYTYLPGNVSDITCTLSMTFSVSSMGSRSAKLNSFKLSSKLYGITNVDIRYNTDTVGGFTSFYSFNLAQEEINYSSSEYSSLPSSYANAWQCIVTLANGQKETFSWSQTSFSEQTVTKEFEISKDKFLI